MAGFSYIIAGRPQTGGGSCRQTRLETDQCKTADEDHDDDERLEVFVFDQNEVDVSPVEPGATDARAVKRVPERTTGRRAALGTTLVQVTEVQHSVGYGTQEVIDATSVNMFANRLDKNWKDMSIYS